VRDVTEARRIAIRTAGIYAVIALAWILVSDFLVSLLIPAAIVSDVQSIKGFLFVIVTGIVIYILVERLSSAAAAESRLAGAVERMLEQVVATVPVGVLLTADDGTITFLNAAAEFMLGTTAEHAVGTGIEQLCCAHSGQGATALNELMRTGATDGIEIEATGTRAARSVLARAARTDPARTDPAEPTSGWVIAIADVTEAQQAHASVARQVDSLRFLIVAFGAAVHAASRSELIKRLAESAVESGRYQAAWGVILDTPNGSFADVATVGMGARSSETAGMMRERAIADATAVPFAQGEVVVSNDIVRDPANVWHPAAVEEGFGSLATVGLGADGILLGGLTLFAADAGSFDSGEVELLHSLADFVAELLTRPRL